MTIPLLVPQEEVLHLRAWDRRPVQRGLLAGEDGRVLVPVVGDAQRVERVEDAGSRIVHWRKAAPVAASSESSYPSRRATRSTSVTGTEDTGQPCSPPVSTTRASTPTSCTPPRPGRERTPPTSAI